MSRGAPQFGQLGVMFGNNTDRLYGKRHGGCEGRVERKKAWKALGCGGVEETHVEDIRLEPLAFDH